MTAGVLLISCPDRPGIVSASDLTHARSGFRGYNPMEHQPVRTAQVSGTELDKLRLRLVANIGMRIALYCSRISAGRPRVSGPGIELG